MARIPVNMVGRVGVVQGTDIAIHMLPVEVWSAGKNVRFQNNRVVKFSGHSQVFGTPSVAPYWAMPVPAALTDYWVYASLTAIYAVDADSVHTNITRAAGGAYAADATALWNGGVLGGIAIMNNGVDVPQFWATPDPATTDMANLTNWPATHRCKVIRPFKQFLVAGNITKGSTNYPHMIRWSHPADPGAVPSSWDETDETKDAGESELTDVQCGVIRDMMELGDTMMIYKDGAIHGMQHLPGSSLIFKFFGISGNSGILAANCVAPLPDNSRHFLATGDDLVLFDGRELNSVLDLRWRKFITDNINQQYFRRSYCVANHAEKSMWFCFPTAGFDRPNIAMEYNLVDKSIGVRDLANLSFIASGRLNVGVPTTTYNAITGTYDASVLQYNTQETAAFVRRLLACDPVNTKMYRMDSTNQFNGANATSFVERTGIAALGVNRAGEPVLNYENRRMITRLYPRMTGSGPINIYVGAHENSQDSPVYANAIAFTPGAQEFVEPDPPVSGRFCAVKFESLGSGGWELEGYDMEIVDLGKA